MDQSKRVKAVFDSHAALYQEKYMAVDLYHDALDIFCQSLGKETARILDVACGPGNITQYLLQQHPNYDILGIDLAPKMLELARINNPSARFQLMDVRDIRQLKTRFEAVVCGFCLPYLSKEAALSFLEDMASVLEPGGVFYLSTMEDDYSLSGLEKPSSGEGPGVYMYYHQADYLTAALEKLGFELIYLHRQQYPEAKRDSTLDLLMIARRSLEKQRFF